MALPIDLYLSVGLVRRKMPVLPRGGREGQIAEGLPEGRYSALGPTIRPKADEACTS